MCGDAKLNQLSRAIPEEKTERLSYCLYRSSAAPGIVENELNNILEQSRVKNQAVGLSGCLHYEDGVFFQWLEGPPSALYPLLSKLQNDDRHINFLVLDQGPLEQRIFQDWQMRFSNKKIASLFDWISAQDKTEVSANIYAQEVKDFLKHIDA